jgi:peptidoglycan/LPS O-acetylase OafA/YrhL
MTAFSVGDLCVGWGHGNFSGGVAIFCFSYFAGVSLWRMEQAGKLPAVPRLPFWGLALLYTFAVWVPMPAGWHLEGAVEVAMVLLFFPLALLLAISSTPFRYSAAVCRWLGDLSYPLYVLHYPIVCILGQYWRHTPSGHRAALAAATGIGCVAAAHILFRIYDAPIRASLSTWLMRGLHPDQPQSQSVTL